MTERQQELDRITDSVYYYMVELTSLASDLEEINLTKEGDDIRSVANSLERIGIRLLNRQSRTHHV